MPNHAKALAVCFLRLPEVKRRTGLGRSSIYEGMKKRTFPQQVPLGENTVGWLEAEISQWCAERLAARDNPPAATRRVQRPPAVATRIEPAITRPVIAARDQPACTGPPVRRGSRQPKARRKHLEAAE